MKHIIRIQRLGDTFYLRDIRAHDFERSRLTKNIGEAHVYEDHDLAKEDAEDFGGVAVESPAMMPGKSCTCPSCGAIATEPYPMTVPVGQPDPGMWRCPRGHIFKPV